MGVVAALLIGAILGMGIGYMHAAIVLRGKPGVNEQRVRAAGRWEDEAKRHSRWRDILQQGSRQDDTYSNQSRRIQSDPKPDLLAVIKTTAARNDCPLP